MISLYDYKNELENIIHIINNVFEIETAIFDTEANLITSTDSYLQHKGHIVHGPSIQEVIYKGNIIVNHPGKMESCIGCRFKDNCPSTMEILKCITLGHDPIGVVTLTSFSREGHDKISADVEKYSSIIEDLSSLISSILARRYSLSESQASRAALLSAMEISDDAYMLIDSDGNIDAVNTATLEMFSSCGLNTKSIYQLFPDNAISVIMSGLTISNYKITMNETAMRVFASPVKDNGLITGTAIRVTHKKPSFSESADIISPIVTTPENIKGRSSHVEHIKKTISKIANSPSTVFISGETGTGKSMLAKAIHYSSSRKNKPFVMINCTSIPESLFESELFGYESGAFTGAKKEGKPGKFELANEGTLFLDEISEIPLNIQAKLLSVIQESSFERVGGITPINVDVRIIAASNQNLTEMIEQKKFRSDLFYRLNVIPVELIPLRERREDISTLTADFLKKCNEKLNRKILGFDNNVLEIFNRCSWPGNIRQLENVIEYCINMTEKEVITQEDLPPDFIRSINVPCDDAASKIKTKEQELILETIDKYGWDVKGKTQAAKELGIGLRTLYRKLNEYNEIKATPSNE